MLILYLIRLHLTVIFGSLTTFFSSNRDIISQVMPIFAPFHLFDVLAVRLLRGTGKQKIVAALNVIGYYVFCFPIGVSLMFAAKLGIIGVWSGLTICVFFQGVFCLVYIWRVNWNRVAEQAQFRARMKGIQETSLDKEGTNGVILLDVIRPENQAIQLMVMEDNKQQAFFTVGDVLTVRQLIFPRGIALAVAVTVLLIGILIRSFNECG
uniref:Solute carrier family 47 member 1 n=1 Tax=Rhinolophus ferrumequinum TaxID=59479 RepID=A0A671EJS5_RHIFE